MNQTSPGDDLRTVPGEENLDRLLSAFFKSKMKQPWSPPPTTTTRVPVNEPSVLLAARANSTATLASVAETPRNEPASTSRVAHRDQGNRARFTLAASVAILLGTCWYFSNGLQPGERTGPGVPGNSATPSLLKDAGASDPTALKELRKDKAEKGNEGFAPPRIKLP